MEDGERSSVQEAHTAHDDEAKVGVEPSGQTQPSEDDGSSSDKAAPRVEPQPQGEAALQNPFGISQTASLGQQAEWIDRERLRMEEPSSVSSPASKTPPTKEGQSEKVQPDEPLMKSDGGSDVARSHRTATQLEEAQTEEVETAADAAAAAAAEGAEDEDEGGEDEQNAKREYNRVCAAKSRAKRKRTLTGLHSKVDEAAATYTGLQRQNKALRENVGSMFQSALSGFLGTAEEQTARSVTQVGNRVGQPNPQPGARVAPPAPQQGFPGRATEETSRHRPDSTSAAGESVEEEDRKPRAKPRGSSDQLN